MTTQPGTYILVDSYKLYNSEVTQFQWLYARTPHWFAYLCPETLTPEQARLQFPEYFI